VQVYLSTDLYERILREAAVQRRSVSECVRDALEEIYAIRDELSRPLEPEEDGASEGGRLAHRLLGQLEERMLGAFSRQLDEIRLLGEQHRRLEAMADRQYVSLMLYLPEVAQEDAEERSANANRRYHAWRRAVEKLLDSAKPRP
jgi:predicted HicB family RNase H-like nuclease